MITLREEETIHQSSCQHVELECYLSAAFGRYETYKMMSRQKHHIALPSIQGIYFIVSSLKARRAMCNQPKYDNAIECPQVSEFRTIFDPADRTAPPRPIMNKFFL